MIRESALCLLVVAGGLFAQAEPDLRQHIRAADSLLVAGQRDAALEQIAAARALQPDDQALQFREGALLLETARIHAGRALALQAEREKAAAGDAPDAAQLQRLADAADTQQVRCRARARQAVPVFQRLQEARPESAELAMQLGMAWYFCDAYPEARAALRGCLELVDPDDPAVPRVRAILELVEQLLEGDDP